MSYALAGPLQTAVYQKISTDSGVTALAGSAIYDVPPDGSLPDLYVLVGQETVRDASDKTGFGAWHDMTISVVSSRSGFLAAKETAGAITDALHGVELSLSRGALVGMWFRRGSAARAGDGQRRVNLIFRARVEDS